MIDVRKRADLLQFSQAYLNKIAKRLNQLGLGIRTPADRLRAVLQ
jgi:hypothetical protein